MTPESKWKVVYRMNGQQKTARDDLAHDGACKFADAMEREGWKHVQVVPQETDDVRDQED